MHVLVADDQELLRDVLGLWFRQEQIEVTTASDLDGAMAAVAAHDPFDLILLDYFMPGMNGLDGLQRALRDGKGAKVAVMSGNVSHDIVEKAIDMGASGFLPKTLPAKSLVHAVQSIAKGENSATASIDTEIPDDSGKNALALKLTSRELQVLEKLCLGKTTSEIALELALQEPTVKFQTKTLCRKIGASNGDQAVAIAKQAGLF
jgi:two-component system, NarL family, nitrate/nitrite response regulator NarL